MSSGIQRPFQDTVSALVYSLARSQAGEAKPPPQAPYNDLVRFVLEQQARLPDYLRGPMLAATLGFDLMALGRTAHLFHSRPPQVRARQVAAWKGSRLSFKRDLVRYYESLATLALHSRGPGEPVSSPAAVAEVVERNVLAEPKSELRGEIVVVGSGPGGALTACLLAEAGRQVLLVEEGPFYALESCVPFSLDEMIQKYRNGGQTVALGRNKIAYVEGRCVGGGSEINSGLYHRTPPDILERWRKEFHVDGLSEAELLPQFEACERELSVSLMPGPAPAASLELHKGATRLGWKSLEVPRWFRYDRQGGNGARQSMTRTFVPRFLAAGGNLLPSTRVGRFRQAGDGWLLEARHGRTGDVRIRAETLFICGGAVQTPALLRRSGVTANIGDALQVHPTIKIVAEFPEPINSSDMGVPVHQVKEFAPQLSFGCSISSAAYLALGLLDHQQLLPSLTERWMRMANYYAMISPEGQGTVRPLGPFRDPLVRYRLTENDRRNLAKGLRKLSELLLAAGAKALYPGLADTPPVLDRDCLGQLPEVLPPGRASLMTIHLFGSCPMGENRRICATDSFGRVHGLKNLHIADASLLCTAPGVNPQGSVMAIARRNALHFLERR